MLSFTCNFRSFHFNSADSYFTIIDECYLCYQ